MGNPGIELDVVFDVARFVSCAPPEKLANSPRINNPLIQKYRYLFMIHLTFTIIT